MPHHLHVFRFAIQPFIEGHSQKCNVGIDYCLIIDPQLRVESPHPRAVPYIYSLSLGGSALTLLQTINNCVWYNLFCGIGLPHTLNACFTLGVMTKGLVFGFKNGTVKFPGEPLDMHKHNL